MVFGGLEPCRTWNCTSELVVRQRGVVVMVLQLCCSLLVCRHVHLRPVPGPRRILPGGVQPLWTGGETAGLRKALRAETRTAGQAVRSAALTHTGLPAAAAAPPQPLSIARDQPHFCFVLGGPRPRGRAAASSPAFTLHATSVQTLQELQGWSPVRRTCSNRIQMFTYPI